METSLDRHALALVRQVFRHILGSAYGAENLLIRSGPKGTELIATDREVDVRFRTDSPQSKESEPCAFLVDHQALEEASRSLGGPLRREPSGWR